MWPSELTKAIAFVSSLQLFLWNTFFVLSFIMLYNEDYSMHHYVGFSQIGSHIIACCKCQWINLRIMNFIYIFIGITVTNNLLGYSINYVCTVVPCTPVETILQETLARLTRKGPFLLHLAGSAGSCKNHARSCWSCKMQEKRTFSYKNVQILQDTLARSFLLWHIDVAGIKIALQLYFVIIKFHYHLKLLN